MGELDDISQVNERCCLDLLTTLEDLEDFGALKGDFQDWLQLKDDETE